MKLMFVCHGNICRSPMAEFIMKRMLAEEGLDTQVFVSSSAVSTEEIINGIGNPVDSRARRELAKHGIDCQGKRAVELTAQDYVKYDLFVGMDKSNLCRMERIFGGDPDGKIHLLLEDTDPPEEVSDPWYTGRFDVAYRDIDRGCAYLLQSLIKSELGQ